MEGIVLTAVPWEVLQWATNNPEMGWVFLFFWLLFELRSDRGRVYQLDKKITGAIIVIRAIARKDEAIDEEKVDDYLVENGMEPEDFYAANRAFPETDLEDSSSDDESSLQD